MATEKLYDLAYRYRDTKLWDKVDSSELFAVKLADGEIGYCCVMGGKEDILALGLFPGVRGYQSCRRLLDADLPHLKKAKKLILSASLDCIRCSFMDRDSLTDEETAEVRRYAASRRRQLRGDNAFARFDKHEPGRPAWFLETDRDVWRMTRALEAALALDGMLKSGGREGLGLRSVLEEPDSIPLLTWHRGEWKLTDTPLPAKEPVWPAVPFPDDLKAARIGRKEKSGVWECGLCRSPRTVREKEDDADAAPWIPLMLVSVEPLTGSMAPPAASKTGDDGELLERFAAMLLEEDGVPRKIRCGDDRTYALLQDLCEKAGIALTRTEKTEDLDEGMEDIIREMEKTDEEMAEETDLNDEELALMADAFASMTDADLLKMPDEIRTMMLDMADEGKFPGTLAWRLYRLFKN